MNINKEVAYRHLRNNKDKVDYPRSKNKFLRKEITYKQKESILDLYINHDYSPNKISKTTGISKEKVMKFLVDKSIYVKHDPLHGYTESNIINLYNKLKTISAVARETKIDQAIIRRVLNNNNIVTCNRRSLNSFTNKEKSDICSTYNLCKSISETSKKYNISLKNVRMILIGEGYTQDVKGGVYRK